MLFLYPAFLWALFAVALPVLIHLFNFRRYKTVYFSNVRFLQQLQIESKSQSQLRQWLVLALRTLFIAALVLCFAQPFIPGDNAAKSGQKKIVSVYIDNSFSMQNVGAEGPLLQIALQEARNLTTGLGSGTSYHLITNDFEGKHQRLHSKEDFLSLLDEIKISAAPRLLSEVMKRQTQFLKEQENAVYTAYYLSDLQKTQCDVAQFKPDSAIKITFLPLTANKVNNLSIDSCWFATPLQQKGFVQKLMLRVKNYGDQKIELGSAKLNINNQQVSLASFSLQAGASENLLFTFENNKEGHNTGYIKIEDYPVTFDDQFYFSFNAQSVIKVCVINGKESAAPNALSQLFTNDSLFAFKQFNEEAIDYSAFKNSRVLIVNSLSEITSGLNSELQNFCKKGGVLLVVPPVKSTSTTYSTLLSSLHLPLLSALDTTRLKVEQLQYNAPFFADVFEKKEDRVSMPGVLKYYQMPANANDAEVLMRLQNSAPYLVSTTIENSKVFLLSTSLNEAGGNLQKHALFVPIIYKICFSGLQQAPLFYTTGKDQALVVDLDSIEKDSPPHLIGKEQKLDIIPEIRYANNERKLFTRGEVQLPGFYNLMRGNSILEIPAFNYSRNESDLTCFSKAELVAEFAQRGFTQLKVLDAGVQSLAKAVAEETEGKKLWKLFLILALGLLALEVLVLRLLK